MPARTPAIAFDARSRSVLLRTGPRRPRVPRGRFAGWRRVAGAAIATFVLSPAAAGIAQQGARQGTEAAAPAAQHARPVKRLLIANAMVIYGNAKPPYGPVDILVEDGLIARVGPNLRRARGDQPGVVPDAVIDATGKYVMPGMVNTHMHWHEIRMPDIPMPIQYERNMYLATGTTTAREVGSSCPVESHPLCGGFDRVKGWRAEAEARRIVSPRIVIYPFVEKDRCRTPDECRAQVREWKQKGADGLKLAGFDRDQAAAIIDEARKVGLPTTVHIAVEETTARDYAELGVSSIEHFYGVGDAALDGIQNFPPEHNANNEVHRFGRAGELYIQDNFNRAKLSAVLELMVKNGVGWSPTMSTYEASRDLIKAQNLPWYRDFLHPSLEEYYKPSLQRHGTYWLGWTSTQEARWRRNYRVWMDALREFGLKGGLITTGDDAGYLYGSLYGFGMIRELELHEEAGFHPLEVIRHATWNGARMIGMGDRLGKVREGFIADLLVVNGNPLENLRILNPYGVDLMTIDGKPVNNYSPVWPDDPRVKVERGGGIEWTIKDGVPYHVPVLVKEIKDLVNKARAEMRGRRPTSSQ
jgi:imidazolonepropionase-like amidohydrolase